MIHKTAELTLRLQGVSIVSWNDFLAVRLLKQHSATNSSNYLQIVEKNICHLCSVWRHLCNARAQDYVAKTAKLSAESGTFHNNNKEVEFKTQKRYSIYQS